MRAPETSRSRRFHRSPGTSRNDWDSANFFDLNVSNAEALARKWGALACG
jgi:hypothetical protein